MRKLLHHQSLFHILVILFLTFLAYSNIFDNQFVWDDQFFILQWEKIRNLKYIGAMLAGALPPQFEGAYRPLLGIFYLFAYSLFGTNPYGYHILSLAIHLTNTVLIYLITNHLLSATTRQKQRLIPFASSLLFGLHPIQTEAITYVAASFNTIGITFFLASFYFYLKARGNSSKLKFQNSKLQFKVQNFKTFNLGVNFLTFNFEFLISLVSIVFALFAFFTYEFTLSLPFLLTAYHFILDRQKKEDLSLLSHLPYFFAAGLYLFIRIAVIHSLGRGSYLMGSFYYTMLAMAKVHLIYLKLLLLPINQSINHLIPPGFLASHYVDPKASAVYAQSPLEPMVILSLLFLFILILTAIKSFKKYPFITFSISWFYLTLAPASNIIPVQELMAERYLYLPSLAFFWVLAFLLNFIDFSPPKFLLSFRKVFSIASGRQENRIANHGRLSFKMDDGSETAPRREQRHATFNISGRMLIIALIASCYLYLTYQRNQVWQNPITFWSDAAAKSPISEIAYYNLGNAYLKDGNTTAAIAAYQQAIKNNPNSIAYLNLGNAYYQQQKYDKAAATYEKGLTIHPNSTELLINLGMAYEKQGKIELARQSYAKALLLDPDNEKAKKNLANTRHLRDAP